MTLSQHDNIKFELQECSNMLYFLTTSIINLFETGEQLSDSEKLGVQSCLFNLKDRLNAAITEFEGSTAI